MFKKMTSLILISCIVFIVTGCGKPTRERMQNKLANKMANVLDSEEPGTVSHRRALLNLMIEGLEFDLALLEDEKPFFKDCLGDQEYQKIVKALKANIEWAEDERPYWITAFFLGRKDNFAPLSNKYFYSNEYGIAYCDKLRHEQQ